MMRRRLWSFQHRYAPYLFLAPFVLLFALFLLYPLGRSFLLSFYKSAGPRLQKFSGLDNYRFLLTDRVFWGALANTTVFAILFLALQIPASLGLALLLNSQVVRARRIFRFCFFSTHLVGQVFVAVLFSLVLNAHSWGLLNRFLGLFAGRPVEINWLGEPLLVMPSILIASLWLSIGFGMLYFLAALQSVDRQLYEAARVDGAGRWSTFWHVTLPSIKPVLVFLTLVGTIGAFQLFELPYVLFQGSGPRSRALTVVMYLYFTGFETELLGYASAIGWLLVLVLLLITTLQIRFTGAMKEAAHG